jgi:hypothetical protein
LRGRLPVPDSGDFEVPAIAVVGAELKKSQLQVFRQGAMLVEPAALSGMTATEPPALDKSKSELGSLVGCYVAESPSASAKLSLAPNVPRANGVEVIWLDRENDTWTAEVDYRLQVSGGLIDVLRFDAPAQWIEPFQLDRPADYEVVAIPGENRRQFVVRPATPIKDQYRVKIRAAVALAAADRMRVPDILPLGPFDVRRFVVLPVQLELQQVVWESTGLRRANLPAEFQRPTVSPESFAVYEVLGSRFQASLKSVERAAGEARVKLAEISIAAQSDGHCWGAATFDLEPAGATNCLLQMPEQYKLLHVSLAELPALATPSGPGQWRLALGSQQLAQRVEVIFAGQLPAAANGGNWQLAAPRLADVKADRTLWTVFGPPQSGTGQSDRATRLSPASYELLQLESLAELLDLPVDVTSEQLPDEIIRWYQPWQKRFWTARAKFGAHLKSGVQASSADQAKLRAITRKYDRVVKHLDAGRLSLPPAGRSPVADSPAELVAAACPARMPAVYMSDPNFTTEDRALYLRYPQASGSDLLRRLIWSAALNVLAWTTVVAMRRRQRNPVAPHALGIVGGAFWWIYLSPSFVGLMIFAVSLLSAGYAKWSHKAIPPIAENPSSTRGSV